ncbi:diguanylate cyclase domain-containing protein [Comamonas resistens]
MLQFNQPDSAVTPAPAPVRGSSSLKLSLILPFVALIALLTSALGMLWYWTGSKTVSSLSEQVMEEKAERIAQMVDRHIHGSSAVLEAAFPEGLPVERDIRQHLPQFTARLWMATSLHTRPNDYVYYGNVAGQGIGLKRLAPQLAELRLKTRADEKRSYYQVAGINAEPVYQSTEKNLFDPRQRPWFKLAQQSSEPVWTPVYIDFNAGDLVLTRARRVLSDKGEFEGVVAADVSLKALNDFVGKIHLSEHGRAFIIESDGSLIASTGLPNIRTLADGKMERMTAEASADPLIQAVYAEVQGVFHSSVPSDVPRTALLEDAQHNQIRIAYRRVVDSAGLQWMAVVAVPHKDILAGVYRHMAMVGGLGALALVIAVLIGTRIFGAVANDMRSLTRAVRLVGQGEIDTPIEVQRRDEIGELAHNFHRMRHSLFTDPLTGASNRSALQHILSTLTRPLPGQSTAAPFALLFVDLNRFKPLNDQWGHDNGDLALAEVTVRLRNLLRPDDVVARLGGDEFVIILRGVGDEEQVQAVRLKIDHALQQPLTTLQGLPAGEIVTVGASVGQALYPRDAQDPQSLLKQADQDMYRNKAPSVR